MYKVYLSLGSNIGDGIANIERALDLIKSDANVSNITVSSFYRTRPVGFCNQPDFVNAVCSFWTDLTPHRTLDMCMGIEQLMGRVRTIRWGPRVIDLDILLYDDIVLESDDLVIPHRRMLERAFVLVPLAEIAPNLFDYEKLPKDGVYIIG